MNKINERKPRTFKGYKSQNRASDLSELCNQMLPNMRIGGEFIVKASHRSQISTYVKKYGCTVKWTKLKILDGDTIVPDIYTKIKILSRDCPPK